MVGRAYDGLLTWQDDVNAAGGINGRKVVLKKVDHKETADGGVAACKEALSNGSYFAMVPEGVDATLTAVSCLDAAGMPTLYYSATTDPKWKVAFADIVTSARAARRWRSFVRNHLLGGAARRSASSTSTRRRTRRWPTASCPRPSASGSSVAGVESVEPNQASFTVAAAAAEERRRAGPRHLGDDRRGRHPARRQEHRVGRRSSPAGGSSSTSSPTAGRNLFDGVVGLRSYATVDTPAYTKYAARMEARGRGRSRTDDLEGFTAYGHALVVSASVLKRAGTNPTRASFVAGAETSEGLRQRHHRPVHVDAHRSRRRRTAVFPTVCCNSDYTWKGHGSGPDRLLT